MSDWDPFWSASPPPSPEAAPQVASLSSPEAPPQVASPLSDEAPSEVAASSQDESSLTSDRAPFEVAPSPQDESALTRELKCLHQCIEDYLRRLGLEDLAPQFMEKAERVEDLPPVPFVKTWAEALSKSARFLHSYPRNDGETLAIASLNEGVAAYLKYLELDLEGFDEKASTHAVRNGGLIHLWIAVVYPKVISAIPAGQLLSG